METTNTQKAKIAEYNELAAARLEYEFKTRGFSQQTLKAVASSQCNCTRSKNQAEKIDCLNKTISAKDGVITRQQNEIERLRMTVSKLTNPIG